MTIAYYLKRGLDNKPVPHKEKLRRIRARLLEEGKIRIVNGEVVPMDGEVWGSLKREKKVLGVGEIGVIRSGHGEEFKELAEEWWPVSWDDALVKLVAKGKKEKMEFAGLWERREGGIGEMIGRIEKVTKTRRLLVLKDSRWRGVWKSALRVKYLDVELGELVELRGVEGELLWSKAG